MGVSGQLRAAANVLPGEELPRSTRLDGPRGGLNAAMKRNISETQFEFVARSYTPERWQLGKSSKVLVFRAVCFPVASAN
jgi:hypothetical protein